MKHALTISALAIVTAGSALAQEPALGTQAQRDAGKVLYDAKCAHCHGINGDADAVGTPYLRPAPRDFTSSTFKFRTTMSGELPSDDDIRRSIRDGMPTTGMPPWPTLSAAEVDNLMYYIKTFSDDFSGPFGIPEMVEIPNAPSVSAESIARGREVFVENQCVDCHGDQGRGDGKSAPTLTDQWGYHIRPADLTKRWTFRNGATREDIYRTFNTGLDGSPMPAYEIEPIEDRWALVDYVTSLSEAEPNYASAVVASVASEISDEAFAAASPALFPIVGQVVEPGRAFYSGISALEIRAVVTDSEVGVQLRWNDMIADTRGSNGPHLPVDENELWIGAPDTSGTFSDAVAIQFPTEAPEGTEMPYFMFGDRRSSVDLWFADLAGPTPTHYIGNGSGNISPGGPDLGLEASFEDGQWTATFTRARSVEGHAPFDEGSFLPIAFSVWDGFNAESGNRRGLSSWYYLYVDVADKPSPVGPMAGYGFLTLLLGVGVTAFMRRKYAGA